MQMSCFNCYIQQEKPLMRQNATEGYNAGYQLLAFPGRIFALRRYYFALILFLIRFFP